MDPRKSDVDVSARKLVFCVAYMSLFVIVLFGLGPLI